MSQFYDLASLVVIPSGYKASTIYAQKPLTTDGQLSFTRASGATRVASNGLIEKVRTNLVLQSQTLDNASWAKTTVGGSITVTANYGAAPDGTNTADRVQISAPTAGAYADVLQTMSVTSGVELTYSVYLKSLSGTPTIIFYNDGVTGNKTATLTSSWARYTFTVSSSATQAYPRFLVEDGVTSASADFLAWGAQLEYGVATDYIPTTTAAVSVGPVSNVPRLDYLGSSCPRLLLEPQRTNLVFFSEQLNNAGWAGSAVVTANTAVSPDGSTNADSVMESATTDFQIIGDPVTTVSGTAYTYSFFAKPNGRNFARVLFGNGSFPDDQSAYFNLLTGATSATASVTASMVSYGNGWYRCIATITSDANATDAVYFGPARNMTDGYTTYAGNASLGIYAYGAQQEAGAYATSYIPTLGASVTRVADAASKTGISSLIGTEFTLFFDGFDTIGGASTRYIVLKGTGGTYANALILESNSSNQLAVYLGDNSSSPIFAAISSALTNGQRMKFAIACKNSDIAFYLNGSLVASQSSGTIPTMSDLYLGYYVDYADNYCVANKTLLFKTRLTNAKLAELTAL